MTTVKRGWEKFGASKPETTNGNPLESVDFMEDAAAAAVTPKVEAAIPVIQHTQLLDKRGVGRPKYQQKIRREKAMNVYFDPETHQLLKNIKFYHDIEMKDVPYLLTREFFKKYGAGEKLSADGVAYLKRLLDEVN